MAIPWALSSAHAASGGPQAHARALLVDATGRPLRAASLQPQVNYIFHYPYAATPVFLIDLGKRVPGQALRVRGQEATYWWPGGTGPGHSLVAYTAICSHKLVYPTRDVSFISFRKSRAQRGVQDGLIHCCADNSQYDPAQGAAVLAGPAPVPLMSVLLEHDPRTDTLTAYATLGADIFDAFFEKYAARLSLEGGLDKAKARVTGTSTVRELEKFCRNNVQC